MRPRVRLLFLSLFFSGVVVVLAMGWRSLQILWENRGSLLSPTVHVSILVPSHNTTLRGSHAIIQARIDSDTDDEIQFLLDGQPLPDHLWAVPPSP